MTWLMAWLAHHAVQIALVGAAASAASSVESLALNTDAIVEKIEAK